MKNLYTRLIETLLANDPAFTRLKLGGRVLVSVVISIILLTLFHLFVHPLPVAAFALGLILSIQGVLMVRDPTPKGQLLTRATGVACAICAVIVGAMLDDYRIAADLMFLVVILFACLARAFGPRGMAAGMYAFMSYFMTSYLRPAPEDIPLAIFGIVLAATVSHITRLYIIREDRLGSLKGAVTATHKRSEQILEILADIVESANTESQALEKLRFQSNRLKDTVLMSEGLIPADQNTPELDNLRVALFELQLAAESAALLSFKCLPEIEPVRMAMRSDRAAIDAWLEAQGNLLSKDHRETVQSLAWLARARADLMNALTAIHELAPSAQGGGQKPNGLHLSFKDPVTRAAIQITLASALAMGAGLMLSRDRWFWAVLSAFLVFINARSRGDAHVRAFQRGLGTVLGIVVGLAIGTLISGLTPLIVVGALFCMFMAFYSLPVSYTRMTFFISILIALAYSLMGMLTPQMMWLRIEETIVGAIAGAFVASTVFPTSTTTSLKGALSNWYDRLEELLTAAQQDKSGEELMALSKKLDAAYGQVRDTAKPLGAPWQLVTKPGQIRQSLAIFLAATYWSRLFARDYQQADEDAKARSVAIMDSILARIHALKGMDPQYFSRNRRIDIAETEDLQLSRRHINVSLVMLDITLGRFLVG